MSSKEIAQDKQRRAASNARGLDQPLSDAEADQWLKRNASSVKAMLKESEADIRARRITRFDPADPLAALRHGRAERLRRIKAK